MTLSDIVVSAAGLVLGFGIVINAYWIAAWIRYKRRCHEKDLR